MDQWRRVMANTTPEEILLTKHTNEQILNIDYKSNVLSNDQSLESIFPIINSVFSSHSQSKVKKYKDGIKNKTDSWLTDSNHESWSSLIGTVASSSSAASGHTAARSSRPPRLYRGEELHVSIAKDRNIVCMCRLEAKSLQH